MNRCFKAKNKYLRKEDMAALKLKKYHNPMLKLFGQKAHIYELSIENLYSGQSAMTIFFPLNEEHRVRFKINAVRSRELYQELVDKKISIDFEFNGKKIFSLANYHINHVKKNHGNDIYIDAGYNGLTDMIKKLFYAFQLFENAINVPGERRLSHGTHLSSKCFLIPLEFMQNIDEILVSDLIVCSYFLKSLNTFCNL